MYHTNTFMQIMKFFPTDIFNNSVATHTTPTKRRRFTCYHQLLSLVFGQLRGCSSLHELEHSFNVHTPPHTTISKPPLYAAPPSPM